MNSYITTSNTIFFKTLWNSSCWTIITNSYNIIILINNYSSNIIS